MDQTKPVASQSSTSASEAVTEQKDCRDCSNGHSKEPDTPFAGSYQRYYHVFKEGELPGLVSKVSQLLILDSYYDHENWCVVAERKR